MTYGEQNSMVFYTERYKKRSAIFQWRLLGYFKCKHRHTTYVSIEIYCIKRMCCSEKTKYFPEVFSRKLIYINLLHSKDFVNLSQDQSNIPQTIFYIKHPHTRSETWGGEREPPPQQWLAIVFLVSVQSVQ